MSSDYTVRLAAQRRFVPLRGLDYHVLSWGDLSLATPEQPALLLLHGWMDVAASFQFVVDALQDTPLAGRPLLAPDWRGFGLTRSPASPDCFWFPDYLADLDALLDALLPGQTIDLLGHSMGGNIAMIYAGVRPQRIRRLVNLEGFGMPQSSAAQAPGRYERWLDELKTAQPLRSYASAAEVAARLQQNNPLLPADKAAWLSRHWAAPDADGRWHLLADAAHKRINPALYRKDEALACWRRISAPVLWVEGDRTDVSKWWGQSYPRSDFEERIAQV
ncbi:MAG: hypothetical protein RJA44_46, partial [Pseudomonadota bacterium]